LMRLFEEDGYPQSAVMISKSSKALSMDLFTTHWMTAKVRPRTTSTEKVTEFATQSECSGRFPLMEMPLLTLAV